jgi:hypothetical protein
MNLPTGQARCSIQNGVTAVLHVHTAVPLQTWGHRPSRRRRWFDHYLPAPLPLKGKGAGPCLRASGTPAPAPSSS